MYSDIYNFNEKKYNINVKYMGQMDQQFITQWIISLVIIYYSKKYIIPFFIDKLFNCGSN